MIGRILDWNTSCASGSCMVGCLVAIAVLALVIGFFVYRGCAGEGAPSAEPAKREWTAKEQVKNPVKYLKDQLAVPKMTRGSCG